MLRQFLILSCLFTTLISFCPKSHTHVSEEKQKLLFDWKYREILIGRSELHKWVGQKVGGVLFNTKYKKKSLGKDQVQLTAFVYDEAGKLIRRLKLDETGLEIKTDESKIFSNYGMSGVDFMQMVDYAENHAEVSGFVLTPQQTTVTTSDGENLSIIQYEVRPVGTSQQNFMQENKRLLPLTLNPSPPAKPGFS